MNQMTVAGRAREKIKRIDKQLIELVMQQNEIEEMQSLNQRRSIYETLFAQSPPSLVSKIESIKSEIAILEHQRDRLYDIVKQHTDTPVKDWSDSPFFFQRIKDTFGYKLPIEHITLIAYVVVGTGYMMRSFLRAHCVVKAAEYPVDSELRHVYRGLAGVTEEILQTSSIVPIFTRRFVARGFLGLGVPLAYMAYQAAKYREKKNTQ